MSVVGVYVIRCTANGRVYVGSSSNVEVRRRRHVKDLRQGKHQNSHLQRAWDKYGDRAFTFEVVATPSLERLAQVEQTFIDAVFALGVQFNQQRRALMSSEDISARTKAALPPLLTAQERKQRRRRRYEESQERARVERGERIRSQPPMRCNHRRCGVEFSVLRMLSAQDAGRRHYCSLSCRWAEEALLRMPQRLERKRRARRGEEVGHAA